MGKRRPVIALDRGAEVYQARNLDTGDEAIIVATPIRTRPGIRRHLEEQDRAER